MNIDKRLIKLLGDSKKPLILAVTLGVLEIIALIAQAGLLAKVIDGAFLKGKSLDDLSVYLILFAAVSLVRALFSFLSRAETVKISAEIRGRLYQKTIKHVSSLGPSYVKDERAGELVNTAFNGINKLDAYFSQYIPQLFYSALIPLSILFFVFPADILSGFVLLLTAPIIPVFMNLIGSAAAKQTKKQWSTLSRMSAYFLDVLQGIGTLKLFGRSKPELVGIDKISDEFRKITMKVLRIAFLSALVLELAATISVAVIAVEIGLRLLYNKMDFEQALFILILAPEFYQPLRQLGARFHAGMEGVSAAQRIFDILNITPPKSIKGKISNKLTMPEVEFKNIVFAYENSSQTVLNNISFRVIPGKINFLIGKSGAGKSTIAGMLAGLLRPQSGDVLLNGVPVDQYDKETLREQVALLKQNPYIFHDTVYQNLIIAQPQAKIDTIYHATKAAQLHDFILSLPNGYQTVIGEQGEKFSGGQIQRLALARVILRNAPLMVLDEPTSNLDIDVEKRILTYLREESCKRTVLIITHRLSAVSNEDNIIYLENGKTVKYGNSV
jgi:ATP-binding cassette subfamily C protein CydD